MDYKLYGGDCLGVMSRMPPDSIDAIVTDPPYGLSFMGKKWDYDVPSVELWEMCLRVLKPGGHLLSFAGTRTHHRMTVNIEDAGFEIRDMIAWIYGSGFPKSLDVSKAIDKAAGADREVVGSKVGLPGYREGPTGERGNDYGDGLSNGTAKSQITAPATDAARQWEGWGTALKPALEPLTLARKPLKGTVAANVLEWGTGGLNIDGCRVGTEIVKSVKKTPQESFAGQAESDSTGSHKWNGVEASQHTGRWPANLIHDGSDEVVELFPGAGDKSAARFYYCAKASKKERDDGLKGEHNSHPTVKPTELMRYLCRLVTPPGGVILDPFTGSGSTGRAALMEGFDFIGIELDPIYFHIALKRMDAVK